MKTTTVQLQAINLDSIDPNALVVFKGKVSTLAQLTGVVTLSNTSTGDIPTLMQIGARVRYWKGTGVSAKDRLAEVIADIQTHHNGIISATTHNNLLRKSKKFPQLHKVVKSFQIKQA